MLNLILKGFRRPKIEIDNNKIIIESLHGKDISGHLFALASKLNNYTNYSVFKLKIQLELKIF